MCLIVNDAGLQKMLVKAIKFDRSIDKVCYQRIQILMSTLLRFLIAENILENLLNLQVIHKEVV